MKVSDFDYTLPEELIAQHPLPRRDLSRMMVVDRADGRIEHLRFIDLPNFFSRGDVLVVNETRVIPARIWGQKGDARVEFLFIRKRADGGWETLCRPAKRIRQGDSVLFTPAMRGEVTEVQPGGKRVLMFTGTDVLSELKKSGFAPLPPYIKRTEQHLSLKKEDLERYQTVFARRGGSIAAPTAGMHFTPEIIGMLRKQGVDITGIVLDVGLATFQPVRVARVEDHAMLEESYLVTERSAGLINAAREAGRPVTAVGTTSVRALESSADSGCVAPGERSTGLFIYPGYRFQVVDRLLTNFHLPRSTLLMLVAAFAGREMMLRAYQTAVQERYRFFSYGDCMLIL